jgi:hypothetical protein
MYLKYYNVNLQSLDSIVDGDKVRFDISGVWEQIHDDWMLSKNDSEVARHIKDFIWSNISKIQKITTI